MKPIAVAVLLSSLVLSAAHGQEVPADTAKDLWCGAAFAVVVADAPTDVDDDKRKLLQRFTEGSDMLIARAKVVYLESGFSEESFSERLNMTTIEVVTQFNGGQPAYFYDTDCAPLIGVTP